MAIGAFTQADIDGNLLVYVHDGSNTTSDSFGFDVDDGLGNALAGRQSFAITVNAVNTAPTVTITAPAEGATFNEGEAISFTGSGSDAEDGDVTSSLEWVSDRDGVIGNGGTFSKSDLTVGVHTITATATDSGGLTGADQVTITVNPSALVALEVRVAAISDDAEEKASGRVALTSSDLELVFDKDIQTVGMRFNAINIPQGANISNAYVQFQAEDTNDVATSLTVQGEDVDNAATFARTSGGISSRARTTAAVSWAPVPWTTRGEAGPSQQTPDIASVIQKIA